MRAAVRLLTRTRLRLAQDPSALLAAGALQATEAAGLELGEADFLIVAVPAGQADDALALELEAAAQARELENA